MKIALMNEWSQAAKNPIIYQALKETTEKNGHIAYNLGMKGPDDHRLTYIHLGIMASLLLNSKAVDFVITGCGTGQGALMSLNAYPGVVCGYCIEPTDAYLFAQINNGNALSLPFAKGFGWGAELNLATIFAKAFDGERGQGYPPENRESQNTNAALLLDIKRKTAKPYLDAIGCLDKDLVGHALAGKDFQAFFKQHAVKGEIKDYILDFIV